MTIILTRADLRTECSDQHYDEITSESFQWQYRDVLYTAAVSQFIDTTGRVKIISNRFPY